ncbi:hypothetical protein R3P38DRAFT_3343137 [Favolaschia claudopus]|uniref:Uncharacterized protein n=1 Tax=Favolaschia claudopus TaxID=2862362 RepID=A0AAW0DLX8_9AGAR
MKPAPVGKRFAGGGAGGGSNKTHGGGGGSGHVRSASSGNGHGNETATGHARTSSSGGGKSGNGVNGTSGGVGSTAKTSSTSPSSASTATTTSSPGPNAASPLTPTPSASVVTPTATSASTSTSTASTTASSTNGPASAKRVSFPPPLASASASSTNTTNSNNTTPSSTPITAAFLIAASAVKSGLGLDDGGDPNTPTPSSSRPAPPSPALSRRTSLARSESRRNSGGQTESRRSSAQLAGGVSGGTGTGTGSGSPRSSPRSSRVLSSGPPSIGGTATSNTTSIGGGTGTAATPTTARHRLSQSISAADVDGFVDARETQQSPEPQSSSTTSKGKSAADTGRPMIVIRDFGYPADDARYAGLGPDVPTPCAPEVLDRRLRGEALPTDYASMEEEEDDDMDMGGGWGSGGGGGFIWGRSRLAFDDDNDDENGNAGSSSAATRDGVGAEDFARNFGDGDGDEGGEEEEEEMYYAEAYEESPPGLYRAQFPFVAVGETEMNLVEGQLIHVLGRGGGAEGESGSGAGWAVARHRDPPIVLQNEDVLEVNAMVGGRTDPGRVWGEMWAANAANMGIGVAETTEKRALVPDSYIVMIRGEGEREGDAHERLERYLEWVERERQRQEEEQREQAEREAAARAAKGGHASPDSSEEGDYEDAQVGDEGGHLAQS